MACETCADWIIPIIRDDLNEIEFLLKRAGNIKDPTMEFKKIRFNFEHIIKDVQRGCPDCGPSIVDYHGE